MESYKNKQILNNFFKLAIIILLCIIISFLVYKSGGTSGSWAQLNFIPIILAAFFWKEIGGISFAVILGLINGPLMPLNRFTGEYQSLSNWLFRILIYIIIATITASIIRKNEKYDKIIKDNYLKSHINGLYNANKLFIDLDKFTEQDIKFHLIYINITNLNDISKYVDFKIVDEINSYIVKTISTTFNNKTIYSVSANEYMLIIQEPNEQILFNQMQSYINDFIQSIKVNDYCFKLIVKMGILKNDKENFSSIDLFNKVRIAADQGHQLKSGVFYFDKKFEEERKLYNEISGSLYQAIKNNELFLVYQPVIDIINNKIYKTEVLVRWDRGKRKYIGPNIFVKIAEEIGLINLLTKWVEEHAVKTYLTWKEEGVDIKQSVNVSSSELLDEAYRNWTNNLFAQNNLECEGFGIEITERVLSEDNVKLKKILTDLQDEGYLIEIDDFGTGYNSLMFLGEIPSDIIKIDKYFIDRINIKDVRIIISNIIDAVHKTGATVIAEGVETKEQYMTLKDMGCDMIQGYYFSKPLLSKDFIEYYKTFDINKYL